MYAINIYMIHNWERFLECLNEICPPSPATHRQQPLGGHLDLPEDLRGVKVNSDSQKVVDSTNYDRISCGHKESQHTIKMDMQC